jgi:hypothetical protein
MLKAKGQKRFLFSIPFCRSPYKFADKPPPAATASQHHPLLRVMLICPLNDIPILCYNLTWL